jgi:hypothetical protein
MNTERENSTSVEMKLKPGQIKDLCGVFQHFDRHGREGLLYVGWDSDHHPQITEEAKNLSPEAQKNLIAYYKSGLKSKEIRYSKLIPVQYAYTGSAIDFKDQGSIKAEDLVTYGFKDSQGQTQSFSLGEYAVLNAIAASRSPWQTIATTSVREVAITAKPMYTLFVPTPEMNGNAALVVLFEPPLEGESNEATFKSFVRETIGRLLILEESQERVKDRKGYLNVAANYAAGKEIAKKGPSSLLRALWEMGFVEFSDDQIKNLGPKSRSLLASGLKIARGLGLMEFNDETLERYKQPPPYYDIDKLDINLLLDLATDMRDVARNALGK